VGRVGVWIVVYKERPASRTPKRREMRPEELHWVTKSDRTNYLKACEDALKGIVFRDDCQVIAGEPLKLYGTPPRTEIMVRAVWETPEELYARAQAEALAEGPCDLSDIPAAVRDRWARADRMREEEWREERDREAAAAESNVPLPM
jgi:hypothetical protein